MDISAVQLRKSKKAQGKPPATPMPPQLRKSTFHFASREFNLRTKVSIHISEPPPDGMQDLANHFMF